MPVIEVQQESKPFEYQSSDVLIYKSIISFNQNPTKTFTHCFHWFPPVGSIDLPILPDIDRFFPLIH
jgi:hypothetical protein